MRKALVIMSVCLLGPQFSATSLKTAHAESGAGSLQVLQGDELTAVVSRLDRLKPGPEQKQAVAQLAQGKDITTDEIERQMAARSQDFGWVHTSVRVLEQINTKKSRTVLRKIAMGKIDGSAANLQAWAARALLKCDQKEALGLLSSDTDDVIAGAILSLRGEGIDQALLNALKPHIKSENPYLRSTTATIMASEAPAGELAGQALQQIKIALSAVDAIPELDKIDPSSGRLSYQMTVEEGHYQRFMSLLSKVKADNDALFEMADELNGRARDTVLLSLAWRAEPEVHDEIVRLLQDPDAGMFRAWAASALLRIYQVDDLPLLRKIAKSDPLERGGGGDVVVPKEARNPNAQYPVRLSAGQTVKSIERAIEKK